MDFNDQADTPRNGSFVISRSWSGNYVWKLQDADGRVLETSTARFNTYEACADAIERIKQIAPSAVVRRSAARSRLPMQRPAADAGAFSRQ